MLEKAPVPCGVPLFAAAQHRVRRVQKEDAPGHTLPQGGQLGGQQLLHRPVPADGAGVVEGVELDLLRAKVQDGAGVRLGGLPAADLLPDPQALDGQVVGQAGLVQAPPAHLGQDGGVVLQADVEGRVMGGQPAGGAGLAHRHAALQGQHQRPGAGGQPRLANHLISSLPAKAAPAKPAASRPASCLPSFLPWARTVTVWPARRLSAWASTAAKSAPAG